MMVFYKKWLFKKGLKKNVCFKGERKWGERPRTEIICRTPDIEPKLHSDIIKTNYRRYRGITGRNIHKIKEELQVWTFIRLKRYYRYEHS